VAGDELNTRYEYNKTKWENDYDRSFTKQLHLMALNHNYKKNLSPDNYKDLIESYTDFSSILEAYNLLISNNSYTDNQYQKIKEIKEMLNEADQLSLDSNFSEEMEENINQLLNTFEEHKLAIESNVKARIEALDELTIELLKGDKVSKEWSLLLSSFTNKWNKKDFNEEQVNELYKIASLCLQKYGERVAIARGLLVENNFVDFSYSFDSCNDVIEQRQSKIENELQVSVFPNPTSQNITVEVNSKNTNIKVFSSTGNIVSEIDVLKKYSFEFTLNSGIYYILVTDEAGHQQIKKVVCIQ
jgi:tRNA nucleotidyltransferase/poly(A) polymerase